MPNINDHIISQSKIHIAICRSIIKEPEKLCKIITFYDYYQKLQAFLWRTWLRSITSNKTNRKKGHFKFFEKKVICYKDYNWFIFIWHAEDSIFIQGFLICFVLRLKIQEEETSQMWKFIHFLKVFFEAEVAKKTDSRVTVMGKGLTIQIILWSLCCEPVGRWTSAVDCHGWHLKTVLTSFLQSCERIFHRRRKKKSYWITSTFSGF